jgi:transcriptional regulator with XRE-family HTH domain
MDEGNIGARAPAARSVNDDMRRAAANLATIIRECGVSQSELSRRSGVSRQVLNAWARQRVTVSLSATVGQFLSCIQMTVADLLLDEQAVYKKLGRTCRSETEFSELFPRLTQYSNTEEARKRREAIIGLFRYRTRLKESPDYIVERTFLFESSGHETTVKVFNAPHVSNELYAQGVCFYSQSAFYVLVELNEPPHQPVVYAYRDPNTPKVSSLRGVLLCPILFGPDLDRPYTRLVYMNRVRDDGSAIAETGFDPELEFNTFIPRDACTDLMA